MIDIVKVNKYFNRRKRNEIHIINNTSLSLENSGLVALLGKSGSGKTTLLNAIGGLDKVNSGKIFVNGKKITKRSAYQIDKIRNLNIGYIFQDYKLIENMSVFDNVAISLRMIGLKNKKEIEKRVNYVLEAVGMYRYKNRPAQMLSGGEKQRVAIARAIVKNPSIVIADEPTGNLDSKNSLEIMNIIKAISKEKLVILVTHEVELANFYATRIVEIQDGKVIKDKTNNVKDSLEYRLDNKIYLKDFDEISKLNNNDNKINVNVYSNNKNENIDIDVVIKNGNIFIKSNNRKIEVVDDNSAIEFINEHYKKIDKSIYEEYKYDLKEIESKKYKAKYSSIYGIIKSIKTGFNRIINYTTLKKFLLLGFLASAMFALYGVCNIAGSIDIRESDFMKIDRNYLQVENINVGVDNFIKYEQDENVDYIIPSDSYARFKIKMDQYYQLSMYSYEISGSLVDIKKINEEDIVYGRMPQNEYELVIDKRVVTELLKDDFSAIKAMGIKEPEELLNKIVTIDGMKEFTIVGFTDDVSMSIYAEKSMFYNILNNMSDESNGFGIYRSDEENSNAVVKDYNLYLDDIKITKGRLPENDYEVIVNKSNEDIIKLNKTIKEEVNGKKLTVVGYYESKTNKQEYLVNNNTVKYNLINENNSITIYPKDKQSAINEFESTYNLNVIDRYEKDNMEYVKGRKEAIKSAVIFASTILIISLVEIYLMIRSSFLSRIKEIGVLRAIGIKKSDIYRMFVGEIIAITTCASIPGIILMSYILAQISKIPYVDRMFIVNFSTIGITITMIYIFNIIVGLLPLFRVISKTPAKILARHDVE